MRKVNPIKMELHPLILSLLILIIVSDAQSRSLEAPVQCRTTSCTAPENVLFTPGYTHGFQYEAVVESSFHTNAEPDSKTEMTITTNAYVDAISSCDMVLWLQNTHIQTEQQPSWLSERTWIESLEGYPLHFSWIDGRIHEVGVSDGEPAWALNIKRGILSTMQVSSVETAVVKETDVTGLCDSSYSVDVEGATKTINKTKLYDTCVDRDEYLLFSYFTPYSADSPRQNFIYSSQTCQQVIQDGFLESVRCAEKHTFRPFSSEESGAQTTITQVLTAVDKTMTVSPRTLGEANPHCTTLKFEKEDHVIRGSTDISEIRVFINDLCARMNEENYVQVGKEFVKFIAMLRPLDASAIEQVDGILRGACPSRENAMREMFRDALQWCGSEGCVVYVARLIAGSHQELGDELTSSWLNGMSLITSPTLSMLEPIMAIAKGGVMKETSYLIAGTMVHRLCESHGGNCLSQSEIRNALVFFETKLGTNCRTTSDERKQEILFSLRALGNAGRTNSMSVLASCVAEDNNDMETRIAAIETFRRMPCISTDRSVLRRMFLDVSQDSEIRIGSYLGLMKCPNPSVIQEIIIRLDDEEVQQVAGFVWSHLDQLMKSNDPLKGYIKPLLMEAAFAKKHDLDPRKYSRYYEASVFSEKLNAGATVESSIVWSPKSFVPRSADLGLSVNLFGQAVNLLEVGGRVEGVESLLQSVMGSDGNLKSNPLQFLMSDDANDSDDDDDDDDDEPEVEDVERRSSRSANSQQVNRLQSQYQRKLNTEDRPNANWYFRVFGNEMVYGNLRSIRNRRQSLAISSIINQLIQNGQYEYHDNAMIMNSEHYLPTGAGLPMNIAFKGSASVDVNVNGEMNLKGLFSNPPSMALNGLFEPRATVVISGTMTVDAHVTKIGIATESSALTSIRLNGEAELRNGEDLQVQIGAPFDRNTLFSFNHKLMKVNGEEMEEIGDSERNTETDCSGIIAGQQFCIEKPRTFNIFPVAGPIAMSAFLNKTDPDIASYRLHGTLVTRNLPASFSISLEASAPESSAHSRSASLQYDLEQKTFNIAYDSGETQIALNGQIEAEPMRKTMTVSYVKNGVTQRLQGTFEHRRDGDQKTWIATSQLVLPEKTISGSFQASIEPYRSLSADFSIENLLSSPLVGNITLEDESAHSSRSLNYRGRGHLSIPGYVNNGGHFNLKFLPRSNNIKFGLDYQFNNMEIQKIVFNHKRQNLSTSGRTSWRANQKFTMTQFSYMNHHIDILFTNERRNVESSVKFSYGSSANESNNTNYVLFNQTFSYSNSGPRKQFDGSLHFAMPASKFRLSAAVNHLRSDAVFNTSVSMQDYTVQLVMQDDSSVNNMMNKSIRVEIPTPWGSLLIENRLAETRRNVYELNSSFGLGSSRGLSVRGNCILENQSNRKRFFVDISGEDQNLLTAESLLEYSEPALFSLTSSIDSQYTNPISFNIRRARHTENRIIHEVLFAYNPHTYFNAIVLVGNGYGKATLEVMGVPDNRPLFSLEGQKTQSGILLTYSTNTDIFDFRKLVFSAEYIPASNSRMWFEKNDLRLIDLTLTHPDEGDYSMDLQQQVYDTLPASIVLQFSFLSDGGSFALSLDDAEKLTGRLTVNSDTAVATLYQHFLGTIPSRAVIRAHRNSHSIDLTLNYGSKQISVELPNKLRKSMPFAFSHNDEELLNHIPRNVRAVLNTGIRSSDNGKGVWLVSTVDFGNGEVQIDSELMLFKGTEKALVFKIEHDSSDIEIPNLNAKAFYRFDSSFSMGSFVEYNSESLANLLLTWRPHTGQFSFDQRLNFLPYCIPNHLRAEATFAGSLSQLSADLTFELEQQRASMTLRTEQTSGQFSFDQHLDFLPYCIPNHLRAEATFAGSLSQLSADLTFELEQQRASMTLRTEQTSGQFSFDQHLDFLPYCIPNHLRAEATFAGSLSQISADLTFELEEKRTGMTIRTGQNDEIINLQVTSDFLSLADFNLVIAQIRNQFSINIQKGTTSFESTFTASEADNDFRFTVDQNLLPTNVFPRKVKLDISFRPKLVNLKFKFNRYAGTLTVNHNLNSNENSQMMHVRWESKAKLRNFPLVPRQMSIGFSLSEENVGSVNLTWNEQVVRASVTVDIEEKLIHAGLEHTVDVLSDNGIPESLQITASGSYSHNDKTIETGGTVAWNDKTYTVYFHNFLDLENSPRQINTTFGHNIRELYSLTGLPEEISLNITEQSQGLGSDSLNFDLKRVYPGTENRDLEIMQTYNNNARIAFNFSPLLNILELTLFHDFNVPESIPHFVKLDGSAALQCLRADSDMRYCQFDLGLQRDDAKHKATLSFQTNSLEKSIMFKLQQNATELYKYGIPKEFMVKLVGKNFFDTNLEITYDTSRKSIGFKIDYHGEKKKVVAMFYHNFAVLAELGVPKRLGFVIAASVDSSDAELQITTYCNKNIKNGHFEVKWTIDKKACSFEYQHHQNATANEQFPRFVKIVTSSSWYGSEFESTLRFNSGEKTFKGKVDFGWDTISGKIDVKQTLNKQFPKKSKITMSYSEDNNVLELGVTTDGTNRLSATVTPNFRKEERFASISVDAHQTLVESHQNINIFANASIGMTSSFYLSSTPNFKVAAKAKWNPEAQRFSVELSHSQNNWKKIVPKKVKVVLNYVVNFSSANSDMSLNVNTRWGTMTKTINFEARHAAPNRKTFFIEASLDQTFVRDDNVVPMSTLASFMYSLSDTSGVLQANATLDGEIYTHSIEATLETQNSEIETRIESKVNNAYLEELGVPHLLEWSVIANWEQPIAAGMHFAWGDDTIDLHLLFDQTSKAEFNVSHTLSWPLRQLDFVFILPVERRMQMVAVLNGEEKNVNLSGNFNEGHGLIEFGHNFESLPISSASIQCNYRFSPDYHVAVIATVDGQEYRVEGGFRNLENGFEMTTTLLDAVSRVLSIQYQVIPGGISIELDHNIPEIVEYMPESTAFSASLQRSPKLNLTTSLRQQQQSQRFSAELDTVGLRFAVAHNFDQLPLPRSFEVQLSTSSEPATYQVRVEIDGVERIASASLDSSNQRVRLAHSISELDEFFVARDVIVGVKFSPESLGGQLYISIDGDERKIGGSISSGFLNMYQTFPIRNVPRNVTLNVKGSLWPLDGAISFTIDEIERSIAAQVESRSLSATATVQVPELESYIPRHLSVQLNFDYYSGGLALSFFKNDRNQTFSAQYNIGNPVHVEMTQSIEWFRNLPAELAMDLSWNLEDKTASLSVSANERLRFTLNGKVFANDNQWYGLTVRGTHNYRKLIKQWGIIRQPEITLRGKTNSTSYSGEVNINLIKNHLFESDFAITPIWQKKQKKVFVTYAHVYDDLTRSVEGTVKLTKQRDGFNLLLQTKQNQPTQKIAELTSVIALEKGELINFSFRTTARQNFNELQEMSVPLSVSGQLSFTFDLEQMQTSLGSSLIYDDESINTSADVRLFDSNEKIGFDATATLISSFHSNKYNLFAFYMPRQRTVAYQLKVSDPNTEYTKRLDKLDFSYVSSSVLTQADLQIRQNELNQLGVPERMSVLLEEDGVGINKHWRFNFTIAGMPSSVAFDFVTTDSPKQSIEVAATFDTTASLLTGMGLPSHALVEYSGERSKTSASMKFSEIFRLEYNDKLFVVNGSGNYGDKVGAFTYETETNFPKLTEWIGGSQVFETYSYAINGKGMTVHGETTIDGTRVGEFNFTLNLKTKEFTYNSNYAQGGYDVVYRNVRSKNQKQLLFTVSLDKVNLVNINFQLFVKSADILVAYDCSRRQALFGLPHKFSLHYTVDLSGSSSCDFEQTYLLKYNDKMLKSDVSVHGSKSAGVASYEIESNIPKLTQLLRFSQMEEKYAYNFNGKVFTLSCNSTKNHVKNGYYSLVLNGKDMTFDLWVDDDGYKVTYENVWTAAEKSMHVTVTHNKKKVFDLNIQLQGFALSINFTHRRKELKEMRIPKKVQANGRFSPPGEITATVTAGQVTVLDISGSPSQLDVKARDLRNNPVFMANARYSKHPVKSIRAEVESSPLALNILVDVNLTMFEKKTGNSSLDFLAQVNMHRLQVNAFAHPSNTNDAADFLASLLIKSSFNGLRSVSMLYNSTYDETESRYLGNFKATLNSETLDIKVKYFPGGFELNVTQPWFVCAPAVSFSSMLFTDSESYKKFDLHLQWSERPEDYLSLMGKMRNAETRFSYIARFSQPSELLYLSTFRASANGDFSEPNVYNFGANIAVNSYVNEVGVTYEGVLPQLFGDHDLHVYIEQTVFDALPPQFTTHGSIRAGTSLYKSTWTITSDENELVRLVKSFSHDDGEMIMGFLWRQRWLAGVPFSYANVGFDFGRNNGRAHLQIDAMPKMSATYGIERTESPSNTSVAFKIASGPLSPWINFRTLSWNSWYMTNTIRSKEKNVLQVTMKIDNKKHHFQLDSAKIEKNRILRVINKIGFSHPYSLSVFGTPLPNNVDLTLKITKRNEAKVQIIYDDNIMRKPFKFSVAYELQQENSHSKDVVIELSNADIENLRLKLTLLPNSLTFRASSPGNINFEFFVEGQNSGDTIGFTSLFKNYNASPLKLSEFSFSYGKVSQEIEVVLNHPNMERTVLRGDVSRILTQVRRLLQTTLSESRTTNLIFVNGINRINSGYDMYIGYEVQGDATYTLHLLVSASEDGHFVALQTKKNFNLQPELARATVKLIDGRLLQIKLAGNPLVINFVREATQAISVEAERKINMLADRIIELLNSVKSVVAENEQSREEFIAKIDTLIGKVNGARSAAIDIVSEFTSTGVEQLNLIQLTTADGVREMLSSLLDLIQNARDVALSPFTEVYDQYFGRIMEKMNAVLVGRLQPVIVVLRKINAGQLLIELVEEGIHNTFNYVIRNGEISFSLLREPLTRLLFVDESTVIFNIPLDVDVSQLKPLPSIEDVKTWLARSALATTINNGIEKLYSYADDYYRARALIYIPRDELLPPFKGHAFVSGFRHFSTFDKRHYNFESGCATSHVLVSDMRQNNFTVAISYGDSSDRRNSRNSIDVIVKNRHVIVYDDYQVKVVNHRVKELPIVMDKVSILLEGTTVHVRRTEGDLDVACDFTKKICSVNVSPFYFGATAGMAGIYNNEPMDDFHNPSHESMATPADLATTWKTSDTECETTNTYQSCETAAPHCIRLFNDSDSPLRACFPLVDPKPFIDMCKDDTCNDGEAYCASVHAYEYRCSLVGAKVKQPNECIRCPTLNQRSDIHYPMSRNTQTTSLDMVFVVEQGSCLSGRHGILRNMKKFLKKMKTSLRRGNVENVNYRLVGYGGPGASASPSTITIRSKPFTTNDKHLRKALAKVPISASSKHTDILSAISYASRLPFRAGAKAMIVVLPCHLCHDSEISFSDVEWQLRNKGILLHHLPQKKIRAGRNWKAMYGFDNEHAYSKGNPVPSSVVKPNKHDKCEPLAVATGGSVWDQKKMNNKGFLDKFSDYLVEKVNIGERVRCKCEINEVGVPTSVCFAANRP